ncbi:Retrovirus-related Pol polyprotein from transposon 17.6 [Thelohanellus kitauei]|uniref:Retrovirus-related Pol polyprotein from transposon 17.6 n=1 Tax=Thelohanellus kitauei TaxID=669202 RepID=A0A0C2N7T3_THEKT|nr:Retrovirus-related Pol polyprotein from transposon 17.6 [Thelohanellus kitauei]
MLCLYHVQPNSKFTLTCDASGYAVGCVLSQSFGGNDIPIGFGSCVLSKAKRSYSTIEREILAIVWGVKKFRTYLLGKKFTIKTYHNPLKYLMEFKDAHNRRSRWLMTLMDYAFDIEYVPGQQNIVAYGLCRSILAIDNPSFVENLSNQQKADHDIQQVVMKLDINSSAHLTHGAKELWKHRQYPRVNNGISVDAMRKTRNIRFVVPKAAIHLIILKCTILIHVTLESKTRWMSLNAHSFGLT